MASSQSIAFACLRLSSAAFRVRLFAFTRSPIWEKARVPSEGMVTDVVPDAEMGVVLLFWRAAMAGVARESRAVKVRPRARTRVCCFIIGKSSVEIIRKRTI